MTAPATKEREQYIDILRALACILVVLTHCVPPSVSPTGSSSTHAFISFICSPSSELFLAISGALLLPVRRTTKEFLSKRFMRVFPPLLFWSAVIVLFRHFTQDVTLNETLKTFISIPIKPVLGSYWFFYVISGLYIFAPIISKWLLNASKREIGGFLLLWGATLALASAGILFNANLIDVNGNYYFILNSFGGFLGYMVLGSYLRYHAGRRTIKKNVVVPLCILASLLVFAVVGYKMRIVSADFFLENLSLAAGLMVYSVFMLFKDVKINNKVLVKIVSEIALCSYGIYLIHIFVARGLVWNILGYMGLAGSHPAITASVSLMLSLAISYAAVRLIKLLPFGKYIVG